MFKKLKYKNLRVTVMVVLGVQNQSANAGDTRDEGSMPGSKRSRGMGNGTPLQYFCLENSMGRGAWQSTVHGAAKSWTRLNIHTLLTRGKKKLQKFVSYSVSLRISPMCSGQLILQLACQTESSIRLKRITWYNNVHRCINHNTQKVEATQQIDQQVNE